MEYLSYPSFSWNNHCFLIIFKTIVPFNNF